MMMTHDTTPEPYEKSQEDEDEALEHARRVQAVPAKNVRANSLF